MTDEERLAQIRSRLHRGWLPNEENCKWLLARYDALVQQVADLKEYKRSFQEATLLNAVDIAEAHRDRVDALEQQNADLRRQLEDAQALLTHERTKRTADVCICRMDSYSGRQVRSGCPLHDDAAVIAKEGGEVK